MRVYKNVSECMQASVYVSTLVHAHECVCACVNECARIPYMLVVKRCSLLSAWFFIKCIVS